MGKSSSNNVITALLTAEEHHHYDNFFIAVSQKSTLLFQRFVNEIGACWYGQMQTCHSPAFVWVPPTKPPPPPMTPAAHPHSPSTLFNVAAKRGGAFLCTPFEVLCVHCWRRAFMCTFADQSLKERKTRLYQQTLSPNSPVAGTCHSPGI